MKIGIIGAGNVGRTLGLQWASNGHEVSFGVREPDKYKELANKNSNIEILLADEVARNHQLLVLAVPGKNVNTILQSLGDLTGKFLIDATNMYSMQKLQDQFPKAHFAKAFNHIGYNIMENPQINDEKVTLLYCANSNELANIVEQLIIDIGFDPFYLGDNTFAGDLENFALLWIKMSRNIGRNFGFKLIY